MLHNKLTLLDLRELKFVHQILEGILFELADEIELELCLLEGKLKI